MKKNESLMKWIGGIVGAGVTRAVSSLQVQQGWIAARAAHADMAMASTTEAPSMEVHGDDGAWVQTWAIVCMGGSFFLSFGFNHVVNGLSPNIRGMRA